MDIEIRDAQPEDAASIRRLLPRLADFELPPGRCPEHLWAGDAELLRLHLESKREGSVARVATLAEEQEDSASRAVVGATLVTLRPEPLSGDPSAHLEVLVLAESAQGAGVGRRLLDDAHEVAALRGARSMTLHVIATNQRARALYERAGYYGELLRYIRPLAADGSMPERALDRRAERVLDFWFGEDRARQTDGEISSNQSSLWWSKNAAVDQEMRERFEVDLQALQRGELAHWLGDPAGWLAQLLLLDQVPRNIYRGSGRSFAFDSAARELLRRGMDSGWDRELRPIERVFAYLPLEHSELLSDQEACGRLMAELVPLVSATDREVFEGFVNFADQHRVIIERFGRFPHRNELLERQSTAEEVEFLAQPNSSF